MQRLVSVTLDSICDTPVEIAAQQACLQVATEYAEAFVGFDVVPLERLTTPGCRLTSNSWGFTVAGFRALRRIWDGWTQLQQHGRGAISSVIMLEDGDATVTVAWGPVVLSHTLCFAEGAHSAPRIDSIRHDATARAAVPGGEDALDFLRNVAYQTLRAEQHSGQGGAQPGTPEMMEDLSQDGDRFSAQDSIATMGSLKAELNLLRQTSARREQLAKALMAKKDQQLATQLARERTHVAKLREKIRELTSGVGGLMHVLQDSVLNAQREQDQGVADLINRFRADPRLASLQRDQKALVDGFTRDVLGIIDSFGKDRVQQIEHCTRGIDKNIEALSTVAGQGAGTAAPAAQSAHSPGGYTPPAEHIQDADTSSTSAAALKLQIKILTKENATLRFQNARLEALVGSAGQAAGSGAGRPTGMSVLGDLPPPLDTTTAVQQSQSQLPLISLVATPGHHKEPSDELPMCSALPSSCADDRSRYRSARGSVGTSTSKSPAPKEQQAAVLSANEDMNVTDSERGVHPDVDEALRSGTSPGQPRSSLHFNNRAASPGAGEASAAGTGGAAATPRKDGGPPLVPTPPPGSGTNGSGTWRGAGRRASAQQRMGGRRRSLSQPTGSAAEVQKVDRATQTAAGGATAGARQSGPRSRRGTQSGAASPADSRSLRTSSSCPQGLTVLSSSEQAPSPPLPALESARSPDDERTTASGKAPGSTPSSEGDADSRACPACGTLLGAQRASRTRRSLAGPEGAELTPESEHSGSLSRGLRLGRSTSVMLPPAEPTPRPPSTGPDPGLQPASRGARLSILSLASLPEGIAGGDGGSASRASATTQAAARAAWLSVAQTQTTPVPVEMLQRLQPLRGAAGQTVFGLHLREAISSTRFANPRRVTFAEFAKVYETALHNAAL